MNFHLRRCARHGDALGNVPQLAARQLDREQEKCAAYSLRTICPVRVWRGDKRRASTRASIRTIRDQKHDRRLNKIDFSVD
jgi:hypothetical protein